MKIDPYFYFFGLIAGLIGISHYQEFISTNVVNYYFAVTIPMIIGSLFVGLIIPRKTRTLDQNIYDSVSLVFSVLLGFWVIGILKLLP